MLEAGEWQLGVEMLGNGPKGGPGPTWTVEPMEKRSVCTNGFRKVKNVLPYKDIY